MLGVYVRIFIPCPWASTVFPSETKDDKVISETFISFSLAAYKYSLLYDIYLTIKYD